MKAMFARSDADGNGSVSVKELSAVLPAWGTPLFHRLTLPLIAPPSLGIELPTEAVEVLIRSFTKAAQGEPVLAYPQFKELAEFFLELKKQFDAADTAGKDAVTRAAVGPLLAKVRRI